MNATRRLTTILSAVWTYIAIAAGQSALEISLLTCEPGEAIYEQYGHTALRVTCKGDSTYRPFDMVFNYGCFDFTETDFALRFALGHTDYMLIGVPYEYFRQEYTEQRRRVWQQTLNLTEQEAERITQALIENAEPQNRTYRYDFLYNNCTTKCRDIIEKHTDGTIEWGASSSGDSFRAMMHEYNQYHFWSQQTIDILLGKSIDTAVTDRDKLFLPMNMWESANRTYITAPDNRKLVKTNELIINPAKPYQAQQNAEANSRTENLAKTILTILLIIAIIPQQHIKHKTLRTAVRTTTLAVWAVTGTIGLAVSFLYFFSSHPSVDTNQLVWAFNPIPLILLILWRTGRKMRILSTTTMLILNCICLYSADYAFGETVRQQIPLIARYIIIFNIASTLNYAIDAFIKTEKKENQKKCATHTG